MQLKNCQLVSTSQLYIISHLLLLMISNQIRASILSPRESLQKHQQPSLQPTHIIIQDEIQNNHTQAANATTQVNLMEEFEELLDKNYLSNEATSNTNHLNSLEGVQEANAHSDKSSGIGKLFQLKPSAEIVSKQQEGDWWAKLVTKSPTSTRDTEHTSIKLAKQPLANKTGNRTIKATSTQTQTQTQNQNQNAILSMKNHLLAIRSKHKTLITKSMQQLQQLDNRLIQGYKLCLKKKMPLYAGMLYRTRDFVTRMAKDVKNEKKVLEAMSKRAQVVLKDKLANKTLVKEYKQQLAAQQQGPTEIIVSKLEPQQRFSAKKLTKFGRSIDENQLQNMSDQPQELSIGEIESNPLKSLWTNSRDASKEVKNRLKDYSYYQAKEPNYMITNTTTTTTTATSTTKRPLKSVSKHTISINEYNLRKELSKSQNLIDRIDTSTRELTSVINDIIYLFKLNTDSKRNHGNLNNGIAFSQQMDGQHQQQQMSMVDQKKAKTKLLKSPAKLLLERFGKLTMSTLEASSYTTITNSSETPEPNTFASVTSTIPSSPEFKPLFDATNFSYSDAELGFGDDQPEVIDGR